MTIRTATIQAIDIVPGMLVKGTRYFAHVVDVYHDMAGITRALVATPVDDDRQEIQGLRIFRNDDLVTISLGKV
jgi:hypothetical protein